MVPYKLTMQEVGLVDLLRNGLRRREAAAKMGLGYETIKSYATSIISKTGARNMIQAVALVTVAQRQLEAHVDRTHHQEMLLQSYRVGFRDGDASRVERFKNRKPKGKLT